MSKQNFLHLKPHLVLGEAKVGSNWVNYQRASPCEHLLNSAPQAHITRRRMQLSLGGAKIGLPKMRMGVIQGLNVQSSSEKKMPKTVTLDALDNAMTTILTTNKL